MKESLTADQFVALPDIIEDRHQKPSTVITSQIPVKEWYNIIGEKTVADAVLDCIVHHLLSGRIVCRITKEKKN